MAAIPWQLILFSPLGITLSSVCLLLFILFYLVVLKTPAMTFFKASFGRKMIIINPQEDRTLKFVIADRERSLAHVKKRGFFLINPNDVSIESQTKVPMAIAYGNYGISLDPAVGKVAQQLETMGIQNWIDLITVPVTITAADAFQNKLITEEMYQAAPTKMYTTQIPRADLPQPMIIKGESVSFNKVVNYFAENNRADTIESEINWRTSSGILNKLTGPGDLFKWAIILVVVLVGAAIAYSIIVAQQPAAATQAAPQIGGIIGNAANTITGTGIS